MPALKRIIIEMHRRSLWQALGIYAVGSWVGLQVVSELTDRLGMPDWVPGFAVVLFIIGLPIVLATAFVQEGLPGPAPAPPPTPEPVATSRYRRSLTWRNAVLLGSSALILLAGSAGAYSVMRSTGFGPAASLIGKGVLGRRDAVVLADFRNTSVDSTTGRLVTEALRIDLVDSDVLVLIPPARINAALSRMNRPSETQLTPSLALEIAQREGYKAVLQGEVGSAGGGYVITASLVAAGSGEILAGFRERARSDDDLVEAIDRLSRRIRERVGESLRSIRADPPLEAVTTGSLGALRKYTEAVQLAMRGYPDQSIPLLEEATELDSTFAMAHRRLSVSLGGVDGVRAREASARAYAFRDRLTERERYLTIAWYHQAVTGDFEASAQAYQALLRRDSSNVIALTNLASLYNGIFERYTEAAALANRAFNAPDGGGQPQFGNIVLALMYLGDISALRRAQKRYEQLFPGTSPVAATRLQIELRIGDRAATHEAARALAEHPEANLSARTRGIGAPAFVDAATGRIAEARAHLREAVRFVETDPREAVDWQLREARLLTLIGDTAAAAAVLVATQAAFEALPVLRRPYDVLARRLAESGRLEAAQTIYARESAEPPPEAHRIRYEQQRRVTLGALQTAAGQLDDALATYMSLQAHDRCQRCYRFEIASLHARLGNSSAAIALFERVVEEPTRDDLLQVYPQQRAIALEQLGRLYEAVGDSGKAVLAYSRFAELWKDADAEFQPRVRAALAAAHRLNTDRARERF